MEKKYYFRGLGLGIIVTALIMGIALSRGTKREMTDAEVIARAKKLGMIENTTLLEPSDTDEEQVETEPSAKKETETESVDKDVAAAQPKDNAVDPAKAGGEKASQEQPAKRAENETQETPAKQEEATSQKTTENKKPTVGTNEMTKQDEDTGQKAPPVEESSGEDAGQQEAVSITIVSGDGSYTVAKKLEEAGVVSSASAYDDYLCQNGYDKRLRTGTFRIPAGASDEQIARIVSNQP